MITSKVILKLKFMAQLYMKDTAQLRAYFDHLPVRQIYCESYQFLGTASQVNPHPRNVCVLTGSDGLFCLH